MKRSAWLFGLVVLASSASAQDGSEGSTQRTTAGAQRFLIEMMSTGGAYVRAPIGMGRVQSSYPLWAGLFPHFVTSHVSSAEALSHCVLRVHFVPGSAKVTYDTPFFLNGAANPSSRAEKGFIDVDWSVSGGVVVPRDYHYYRDHNITGPRVLFAHGKAPLGTGNWIMLRFTVPEETIERINTAVRYLQENCAAKSSTGF